MRSNLKIFSVIILIMVNFQITSAQLESIALKSGVINSINQYSRKSETHPDFVKNWAPNYSIGLGLNYFLREKNNLYISSMIEYVGIATSVKYKQENTNPNCTNCERISSASISDHNWGINFGIGKKIVFRRRNSMKIELGSLVRFIDKSFQFNRIAECDEPNCIKLIRGYEHKLKRKIHFSVYSKFSVNLLYIEKARLKIDLDMKYNLGLYKIYTTQSSFYLNESQTGKIISLENKGTYLEFSISTEFVKPENQ